MDSSRRYILLSVIILCAALPAIGAFLLYFVTQNPTLRPLGLTKEQLVEFEGDAEALAIRVTVDWGRDQVPEARKAELRALIADRLIIYTDDFAITMRDVPGDRVGVTFKVGANEYGPMAPEQMMDGIIPSLIALDMTKKARE
ncbi:hypothetical protein Dshi_1086 [Dinoroseobacter shibae DFL 12 = DSM 16493]|jgi:hypothetical protein|uniref:Uncharacterized protein n=1 Tax=Dinoroseobacter shibae (strain DSM 16493 / NCIMB 14021 / DFL 12) TaxID=398580 RepID=A8LSL4_DINSH|nr:MULTISPECIES: hypothetical protein [Dinoroseobacter]ABV92828.1 hypothetical protein Dshi_1086 [Dinoroseobacter shibae DFL 12 = DSM 16493]MDD9715928.1 hypothetical protein [Dinoroseobacter sp. PD6]URF47767.1 hypothetical protein M8008_05640 [Dinoroseobacter shibae]URF52077.1 hypothetical protein M8007_05640 [Dinoroseobacter shibae]